MANKSVYLSMDIKILTLAELKTFCNTSQGLFTTAVNQFIPTATASPSSVLNTTVTCYINVIDSGTTIPGYLSAGNNNPILDVMPKYYPTATKGAECSAMVDNLSWADKNLTNYEYVLLSTAQGKITYFVTGILNSSQTLANDPFGSQGTTDGFLSGTCWNGQYTEGLNPF
jgi:hypothetical protein